MFRPLRMRAFQPLLPVRGAMRCQSTSSESSFPLLAQIRSDMKLAMKSKQRLKLQALRALLSEVDKAASSKRPVESNLAFVSLIRKRCNEIAKARDEYIQQGRDDLASQANDEIKTIEEYAASESATPDEMREAVAAAIESIRNNGEEPTFERVIKLVKGGPLNNKFFQSSDLDKARQAILDGQ